MVLIDETNHKKNKIINQNSYDNNNVIFLICNTMAHIKGTFQLCFLFKIKSC